MKNKAFTFIELLFVLFVIMILSAIAVPNYAEYLVKTQVAEGYLLSTTVKKAVSDYYAYHGDFPADNLVAGISLPEQFVGSYVTKIVVDNGKILITFGHQSLAQIQGKTVYLIPKINLETIRWYCDENMTTIDLKYLGACKNNP